MKYCWMKHQWLAWEQYTHRYYYTSLAPQLQGKEFPQSALRQRRICVKCGTMQDVEIANVELESIKREEGGTIHES